MSLSTDDVLHISKLARLKLTEKEIEVFTPQLVSILGYVDMLGEVNTDNVEPTYQVTGIKNVWRKDTVEDCECKEALLESSGFQIENHQVKVRKVM